MTESPKFCARCHEMDWQARSHEASTHRSATCLDCHAGSGTWGWLTHAAGGLRSLAGHLAGKEPGAATAEVRDEWCLDCHRDVLGREVERADTRVAHSEFVAAGQRCVFCHRELVHGPKDRALAPEAKAHAADGGGPPDDQNHAVKPAGERGCTTCHQPSTCQACHGLAMPHPSDWLSTHGRADQQACTRCHEKPRFCEGCHGTPMPHPSDWAVTHSRNSPEPERCTRCHEQQQCAACHERHAKVKGG